ncbi:hypothetical protein DFA_12150 [Cavenderia fasciculata]|uniref:SAPS domain-containing protein n=1 Tax=Cavenderia fasciculata TaxID=261658 RepID=F4QC97_CACFS|nr:uncharacterized protein DFA_12150 [Cavenderia fasciculata]EGG14378.1 hypothetical protein DFA_12150 [Cavenderia fasciculata]|eukprot:XP_004353787.1 hypothetical protein DFA_12150 [Cavenderia fasciculata]
MSFWRNFGFHPISHIETILDREQFTLDELLDEDELLQECKLQNQKLIEFLIKPESLSLLFEYITKEASEESDRKRKETYPFLASEILCMDITSLIDAVYKDEHYLSQLYDIVNQQEFNLGLASYISKVAINFLGRKTIETMSYIKKQDNIIEKFINHLDKSPIVDMLLKIISIEEFQGGAGTLEWLDKSNLIGGIVAKFSPTLDSEFHENASFVLSEIIELNRSFSDSPLIIKLESEETIQKLFDYILSDVPLGTSFLHGLTVIIKLLRRHKEHSDSVVTKKTPLAELAPVFKESLIHTEELKNLLTKPTESSFTTTTGLLSPPLGFHRLKVIEFFADLINSRYLCIDQKFIQQDILSACLLLHDSKLLDRIIKADEDNTNEIKQTKGIRYGYMGFLNSIAFSICEVAKSNPSLKNYLDANPKWAEFVSDSLKPVLTLESEPLGDFRMSLMMPPDDDEDQIYENDNDDYNNAYDNGGFVEGNFQNHQIVYEDDDDDESFADQQQNHHILYTNQEEEEDEDEDDDEQFEQRRPKAFITEIQVEQETTQEQGNEKSASESEGNENISTPTVLSSEENQQ